LVTIVWYEIYAQVHLGTAGHRERSVRPDNLLLLLGQLIDREKSKKKKVKVKKFLYFLAINPL